MLDFNKKTVLKGAVFLLVASPRIELGSKV